jgi:hypothetical protein
MKKPIFYCLFTCLYFFMISGCKKADKKEFTEKMITIAANDSVSIKEIDLTVINQGCGREWYKMDGEHSGERPYCELLIRHKDLSRAVSQRSDPIYIGEVEILVDKINPWGREEDSIPPGGCRLLVRRTSAVKN